MTRNVFLIFALGILLFGCMGPAAPAEETPEAPEVPAEEPQVPEEGPEEATPPAEEVTPPEEEAPPSEEVPEEEQPEVAAENKVLMLGRSVTYHWMEYMGLEWTCDDEDCYTGSPRGDYDDYYFIYYELDYPPEIADSAIDGVDMYGSDADVVFFKFCFVDFAADEGETVEMNKRLVEDVYQGVVVERGKKLVLGNALPQVEAHTEPALVTQHRAFNLWLDNFEATHDNVIVLDLNGFLADSNGNLRPEYAVDPEDSHLTEAAYDEITPEFLRILERI